MAKTKSARRGDETMGGGVLPMLAAAGLVDERMESDGVRPPSYSVPTGG